MKRRADKALAVLRKLRQIEAAGAAGVGVVPVELDDTITRMTPTLTMGRCRRRHQSRGAVRSGYECAEAGGIPVRR